ncbi:MAG: hypothetical protein RL661_1038 [Pseudomonadota bacterium]
MNVLLQETDCGITRLMQTVSEEGQQATAILRVAEVKKDALAWIDGISPEQKSSAYADLAANFVIAR